MAAFDPDDAHRHLPDFQLLQNGPVHHQITGAQQHRIAEQLQALGYTRIDLHAATWSSPDDLHDAVSAAFGYPAHYGRNLDALADCLRDVAEGRYGWEPPGATGLLITVEGFDGYATAEPEQASYLLELAAQCSTYALLFGHRILWLVAEGSLP